jgi:hypothetical protein
LVIWRRQPLAGVLVSIDNFQVTTDTTGHYEMIIPERLQKKEQEITFSKEGYKILVKKTFPQTGEPLNVVMEK